MRTADKTLLLLIVTLLAQEKYKSPWKVKKEVEKFEKNMKWRER